MGISEEEQMAAMLQEMGLDSFDQLEKSPLDEPSELVISPQAKTEEVSSTEVPSFNESTPELEAFQEKSAESLNSFSKEAIDKLRAERNHRDLTVSSLLHLMGLPNNKQITMFDSKVDLLLTKFSNLQSKVDKLNTNVENISNNSATERMEFQINEIRAIMKKFFPDAFRVNSKNATNDNDSSKSYHPKVNNETRILETTLTDPPAEEIEAEPLTDEEYQNLESSKLRQQMADKYAAKK